MKKKDIKKLDSALLDGVDVPDSVLDAARQEMANNLPETVTSPSPAPVPAGDYGAKRSGGAVAVNKKLVAACCACAALIACVAAVVITTNMLPVSNTNDETYNYNIADLDMQEISSVSEYNKENGTNYIGVNFGGVTTYQYSNAENVVLFEQVFTYESVEYTWYIAVNENASFDILQDFTDTADTVDAGGYAVYLSSEPRYAKFYADGSVYYLTGGADSAAVIEILELIIE